MAAPGEWSHLSEFGLENGRPRRVVLESRRTCACQQLVPLRARALVAFHSDPRAAAPACSVHARYMITYNSESRRSKHSTILVKCGQSNIYFFG